MEQQLEKQKRSLTNVQENKSRGSHQYLMASIIGKNLPTHQPPAFWDKCIEVKAEMHYTQASESHVSSKLTKLMQKQK